MWNIGSGFQKRSSCVSPQRSARRHAGADERLVREHAALGIGGRAGRVHHHRVVAEPHAQARAVDVQFAARLGGSVEIGFGEIALRPGPAEQHDVAQLRCARHLQVARVAAAREVLERTVQTFDEIDGIGDGVRGDDGDDVAVLDDVGQFVRLVARIDRHDDAAAECDRKERLDEFRAGVHQQADVVARAHPKRLQRASAAHRPVDELPVGEGAIGEHERERIGVAIRRGEQQVADVVTSMRARARSSGGSKAIACGLARLFLTTVLALLRGAAGRRDWVFAIARVVSP